MLSHRLPPWAFLISAVVPITLLAFLGGLLPKPAITPLSAIAVLWGGAMTTLHWKRLDEAARAAHRWAWYWGGSIGIAGAMITGALMLMQPGLASSMAMFATSLMGQKLAPEQVLLFAGITFAGIAQAAGFLGAWIYWWAAKR